MKRTDILWDVSLLEWLKSLMIITIFEHFIRIKPEFPAVFSISYQSLDRHLATKDHQQMQSFLAGLWAYLDDDQMAFGTCVTGENNDGHDHN